MSRLGHFPPKWTSRSLSSGADSRDPLARNGGRIRFRALAARCVRVLHEPSLNNEGTGNAGCAMHPQPRVQNKVKHTSVVTTGSPEQSGIPRAMVLTVSFALSPVSRALLPPSPAVCLRQLDTGVRVSGPHDFFVRVSTIRQARCPRPSHPTPRP
jgi:hypothetical protein